MRYLITGKYANGDDYGETLDDAEQLAEALHLIARHDHDDTPSYYRVLSDTIKIETEEA